MADLIVIDATTAGCKTIEFKGFNLRYNRDFVKSLTYNELKSFLIKLLRHLDAPANA